MNFLKRIITRFRSAITGRYVSKQYAEEHPHTTIKEKRELKCKHNCEEHKD